MDFSYAEDQSLPINFEESANPGHLLRLEDTELDVTEKTDNHTTPLRTRTMKEYDQLIADLKKENFSLKLRIYFLEERIQQKLGRMDSSEDIHKANIELKVEVQALKRELSDKHGLLVTASNALDTLEVQHKAEIESSRSDHENERLRQAQRIAQLEKLLENANTLSSKKESDPDMQWAKAFSFMDNVSDVDKSDDQTRSKSSDCKSATLSDVPQANFTALQKHCKELEYVIDDLHNEIEKYKARNKRLESNLSGGAEELTAQKNKFAKLKRTVNTFIKTIQEKDDEIKELQTQLQRRSDELKQVNTVSECKNSTIQELENVVGELRSQFEEKRSSNRHDSQVEMEQTVNSLQNSLREKELAFKRLHRAYEERESKLKVKNRESSSSTSGFETEMTKLKNKVALHKGCINKIKECFDAMLRDGNDVNCTQSGFVNDLSKLVSMVKRLASLDAFSLWESGLNRFLISLSSKAEKLTSVDDDDDNNSKYTIRLRDSTAEINRLRFLLSSTEATVRMLGTKLNSHRRSIMSMGQLSTGKHRRNRSNSITSASNTDSSLRAPQDGAKMKVYSSSAPVTPLKSDQQQSSDSDENTITCVDIKVMEEEIYRLRLTVESKDNQLEGLRADFERTRPRCSCNDVAVQAAIDIQTENKVPLKALAASHNVCTLLRRRLEELADFLEQLLQFDENGLLDLSVLTPQKMASIRGHLEMSRVLSSTLSQSLAEYGGTISFAEHQESDSVFEQPNHSSSTSGLDNAEEHDNDGTITVINGKHVPKSCNKSLFWDPLVSGARRLLTDDNDEDNLLLLLKPSLETQPTSNLDDLLVCSLSSTFHESFLTSTNVNGSCFNAARRDHVASESDSWSEPDRGVSQQRIGLDGIGLNGGKTPINSPGRNAATSASTTTSESELVSELGVRLSQKAAHRWKSLLKELKAAKNQVAEVEELNLSLRAELSLYQRVCNDNSTVSCSGGGAAAVLTVAQSPSKLRGSFARHGRLRTGDSLIKNNDHHQHEQQTRLENHLLEISALRKKLEESIRAYDQLREQLEKKLKSLQSSDHVDSNTVSRLNTQIESCMKQIEERDSALCSLHKEKGNLLLEIQQLSDDFKTEQKVSENVRADLAEKVIEVERLVVVKSEQDRTLNEMRCDRDKLQQSLCRAQKLLRNNDASVKSLRDANNALQRDLDGARSELHEEKGKMDQLVFELSAKCKLTQDLESQVESLRTAVDEAVASTRRNCDEQMKIKHAESEEMSAEISTLKQHKSGLEADVVQMRAQLQAALALSRSLKTELSVFERITSTNQNAALESTVTLLVTEMRSLRLQLERSVEANTALRSQLDDSGVRVDAKGNALRLDVNFGVDQYASSVSSPDTASSFSYTATTETAKSPPEDSFEPRVNRQLSKSSDYVSDDATRLHHPTDVYSSPDLGIESDPNRCSSLERAASNPTLVKGIHYLEPGMPSIGSEWTRVASAPTKMVATSATPLIGVTTSFCRKRNCTFPLLRSLADNGEDSNDQSEGFGGNRDIYVIARLEHFKMLEQGVQQSLEIVSELRSKLKGSNSSKANEVVDGDAARKELQLGCTSLRKCLQENVAVLEQFWNVPLPLASCDGDSVENRRLETELLRLHRDLARERKRAEDALIKLEAANRNKEGMEKAIVRQLNKTHCVLKEARGNLEIRQQKTASAKK